MLLTIAITRAGFATLLHLCNFYCVPAHETRRFLFSSLLKLQVYSLLTLQFGIFSLTTYFRYWYALISTGNKLLMAMSHTLSPGAEQNLAT